jgi:hypothetical protein
MTCYIHRPAQQIRPGNEVTDDLIEDAYRVAFRANREIPRAQRPKFDVAYPVTIVESIRLQPSGAIAAILISGDSRYARTWAIGELITVREDDSSKWPPPSAEQVRAIRGIWLSARLRGAR